MDPQVKQALKSWHNQIDKLRAIEEKYFHLEASEKSFYSSLFLVSKGKTVADKEAGVYSSLEWKQFVDGLAAARSEYLYEKRQLELRIKAFDAAYLSSKQEHDAIRKNYG